MLQQKDFEPELAAFTVSIPNRDYLMLQLQVFQLRANQQLVSIPNRDYLMLQHDLLNSLQIPEVMKFQSLIGII